MDHTTPSSINENVLNLCREIDSSTTPVFVDVILSKDSKHQECFDNVKKHIKKFGGGIEYGWIIWETPKTFIEAEFHAVWVDSRGRYIDITPKKDGEEKILFLKNSKKKFKGELIDNIRKILQDNAETRTKVIIGKKMFELQKKYYNGSKIEIPLFEIEKLKSLEQEIFLSEIRKDKLKGKVKIGRNELCPCGSGKNIRNVA